VFRQDRIGQVVRYSDELSRDELFDELDQIHEDLNTGRGLEKSEIEGLLRDRVFEDRCDDMGSETDLYVSLDGGTVSADCYVWE